MLCAYLRHGALRRPRGLSGLRAGAKAGGHQPHSIPACTGDASSRGRPRGRPRGRHGGGQPRSASAAFSAQNASESPCRTGRATGHHQNREPWPDVALHPRCRIVAQVINHVLEEFPTAERHGVDYLYSQATMVFCWRRVSRQAFEARCVQAGLTLETRKRKTYVLVDDACHRLAKVYREAQCPNS